MYVYTWGYQINHCSWVFPRTLTLRLSRAQLAVPSASEHLFVPDTLDREKAQEGGTCLFPALLLEAVIPHWSLVLSQTRILTASRPRSQALGLSLDLTLASPLCRLADHRLLSLHSHGANSSHEISFHTAMYPLGRFPGEPWPG